MSEIWLNRKQVTAIENQAKRTIRRRIKTGYYKTVKHVTLPSGGGKNGKEPLIALSCLSPAAQRAYATKHADTISPDLIPALTPQAALVAMQTQISPSPQPSPAQGRGSYWNKETAMPAHIIKDERVQRIARILQEALEVPRGWKKRAWIEAVAAKYGTNFQAIYRWKKQYNQAGLVGLQHVKSNKGEPRVWDTEALEWWIGLCIKKSHRKISKKALYKLLCVEAETRGLKIGSEASAFWWLDKKVTPQLQALQRGGIRALDNTLSPIRRDYSDLEPFEILVGDQHRFDFWVVDDDTGEVFRPEGYFWQDLRTRLFYGGAVARRYDGHLMGLALRIGIKLFGPFKTIYTDNGKPELSRYIMGIMKDMRTLGMAIEPEIDLPYDNLKISEEINPLVTMPGTHRKAIVRNAKAKMIEGTFNVVEGLLRNHERLPGYCKRLTDSDEEQEVDQKEAQRLALAGKLTTFREFTIAMYRTLDHYNKEKHHRGVQREWIWTPKPKKVTPMDCLQACHGHGWRPRKLSEQAVDLIFLPKGIRKPDRGIILFKREDYEHKTDRPGENRLIELHKGEEVTIRYDPMDLGWLLVFHKGEFLCVAEPVENSSMKDMDLAGRKIEKKRRELKYYQEQYRAKTSQIPDFLKYSTTPQIELAAGQLTTQRSKRKADEAELSRVRTPDELAAEVAEIEAQSSKLKAQRLKRLPERPTYFLTDLDRFEWCVNYEMAGGTLQEEDVIFKAGHESRMTKDQLEWWDTYRALGAQA